MRHSETQSALLTQWAAPSKHDARLFELNHSNMWRLMLHPYGFSLMADGRLRTPAGQNWEKQTGRASGPQGSNTICEINALLCVAKNALKSRYLISVRIS